MCVSNYFNLIGLDDLTNSFLRENIGEGKRGGRAKYKKKESEKERERKLLGMSTIQEAQEMRERERGACLQY